MIQRARDFPPGPSAGPPPPGTPVITIAVVHLRLVEAGDSEEIRDIYNHEVANTTNTFDLVQRTVQEQRVWVDHHRGAYPAIVAVAGAEPGSATVIGFGVLAPYRNRAAYATTVEDSVYVHRDHRGSGVGKALLAELVRLGGVHGFHSVIARIASDNLPSIGLHRGCGFQEVGVERGPVALATLTGRRSSGR
jgi:L-amino acid N-acyltransferase YncA